jgi:hypothetical protein
MRMVCLLACVAPLFCGGCGSSLSPAKREQAETREVALSTTEALAKVREMLVACRYTIVENPSATTAALGVKPWTDKEQAEAAKAAGMLAGPLSLPLGLLGLPGGLMQGAAIPIAMSADQANKTAHLLVHATDLGDGRSILRATVYLNGVVKPTEVLLLEFWKSAPAGIEFAESTAPARKVLPALPANQRVNVAAPWAEPPGPPAPPPKAP